MGLEKAHCLSEPRSLTCRPREADCEAVDGDRCRQPITSWVHTATGRPSLQTATTVSPAMLCVSVSQCTVSPSPETHSPGTGRETQAAMGRWATSPSQAAEGVGASRQQSDAYLHTCAHTSTHGSIYTLTQRRGKGIKGLCEDGT